MFRIFQANYTFLVSQHLHKLKPNKFIGILGNCAEVSETRKLHYSFSANFAPEKKEFTIGMEKGFARNFLENNHEYSDTICVSENFNEFGNVSHTLRKIIGDNVTYEYAKNNVEDLTNQSSACVKIIDTPDFHTFSSIIVEKCNELDDTQISDVLICLMKWPQIEKLSSPNFVTLWHALDKECVARSKYWGVKELLLFADLWFANNLLNISRYMYEVAWCLGKKLKHLSPKEFVQFMFYINTNHKYKMRCTNYDIEYYFSKLIDHLSINEIAIVSMVFNRLKISIHSEHVLNYIILSLKSNINTMDSIALAVISKLILRCLHYASEEKLLSLLSEVVPNISRFTITCCVHIAEIGTNNVLLHGDSFNIICKRFVNEIKDVRAKDIERMVRALSIYNYQSSSLNIIDKIVEELNNPDREHEMKQNPRCLVHCLSHLVTSNIYCDDLINRVLSPDFILTVYGKNLFHLDKHLLNLDVGVEIERPSYQGNRLIERQRAFIAKSIPKRLLLVLCENQNIGFVNKTILEILILCQHMFGENNVYVGCLLPQFSMPDVVIGVKGGTEFVPIPECISKWKPGLLKRAVLMEDVVWYCLVFTLPSFYIRGTETPSGNFTHKLRQLRLIGYNPVIIPSYDWTALKTTERKEYIMKKLFGENFKEPEHSLLKNSI